jgi:hypothetical protein
VRLPNVALFSALCRDLQSLPSAGADVTSDYVHPADGPDSKDRYERPEACDEITALARSPARARPTHHPEGLAAGLRRQPVRRLSAVHGLEDKASSIAVWHLFIPRRAFRIQSNFHADEWFVPSSSRGSREAYGSGPMNDAYFKISLA